MNKKQPKVETISTVPFKLKDKNDRGWKAFHLKSQFGFVPEIVVVSKVNGKNNIMILHAIKPKDTDVSPLPKQPLESITRKNKSENTVKSNK